MFSLDHKWMLMCVWEEEVWWKLAADYTVAASTATAELIEEDGEVEEDKEEEFIQEGSTTKDLAPKQVPTPQASTPVMPGFCTMGASDEVAAWGMAASLRAQGKASNVQVRSVPPAKTDEELVCWLYAKEVLMEDQQQGRDVATLEVVMEAAVPLKRSQLEGLGMPTRQAVVSP